VALLRHSGKRFFYINDEECEDFEWERIDKMMNKATLMFYQKIEKKKN